MNNFYEKAFRAFTQNGFLPSKGAEIFKEEALMPFMRSHKGSWYVVILLNMDKISMQEFKLANLTYSSYYKSLSVDRAHVNIVNVLVTSDENILVKSFIENLDGFEPSEINNIFWYINLGDLEVTQNNSHPTDILNIKNLINQALGKEEETSLKEINMVKNPHITLIIIALNVVYYTFVYLNGGINPLNLLIHGAIHPVLILEYGEFYRLITATFLHGSIIHLLMNMYILYSLGKRLENLIGSLKFFILYMISGLFGSIFSVFLSSTLSVGASGAVFGIASALLVILYKRKNEFSGISGVDVRSLISFITINTLIGFTIPLIDFWGHTGGLVGGFLCALIFLGLDRKKKNEN